MLDKAPSTVKAYIAAFKRWHRWATELKRSTLPAKAPHVALFSTPPGTLMPRRDTVSRRTSVDERKSRRRQPPTSHPTVKQLCQALCCLHSRPIHRKPPLSPLQFKRLLGGRLVRFPCRSTITFNSSPHYAFPIMAIEQCVLVL